MAGTQNPTTLRRKLRTELRRSRSAATLTQREVASRLDWSASKLIRIENGSVGITPVDLRALLAVYGETDPVRVESLVEMAKSSRKTQWSDYRDFLSREFFVYLENESSASVIRQTEPLLVPGLLQIEEYARAVLRYTYRAQPKSIDRLWEIRQARQEIFDQEEPPEAAFVLDEAAISRHVGSAAVMRRQLQHLRSVSQSGLADVRVIPFTVGAHQGMRGPFTVLSFPDPEDDDILYFENTQGDSINREDRELTSEYQEIFLSLQDLAVGGKEFVEMVDRVLAGMPASGASS